MQIHRNKVLRRCNGNRRRWVTDGGSSLWKNALKGSQGQREPLRTALTLTQDTHTRRQPGTTPTKLMRGQGSGTTAAGTI